MEYEAEKGFNPLLIGAWVRTFRSTVALSPPWLMFQSPLNRGLGSDEDCRCIPLSKHFLFQSPLNRGLGSDGVPVPAVLFLH